MVLFSLSVHLYGDAFNSSLYIIVGIVGIYLCINDVLAGKELMQVLFENKGYYIISPLLVVCAILRIVNLVKVIKRCTFC